MKILDWGKIKRWKTNNKNKNFINIFKSLAKTFYHLKRDAGTPKGMPLAKPGITIK